MSDLIDEGTYGTIYKLDQNTIQKESILYDEGFNWQCLKELIILSQYKDKYLPKLLDFTVDTKIKLKLPHLDINLDYYMETFVDDFPDDDFTPEEFAEFIEEQKIEFLYNFIFQMARALIYLHGNNIIHNDLKPKNIMVNTKDEITLIDFGSAILKNNSLKTSSFCTTEYRAPEVFWYGKTLYASDIWSLGIICLFILNDYCIMDYITKETVDPEIIDAKVSNYLLQISKTNYSLPFNHNNLSKELKTLISRMLTFNSDFRIMAPEIYCDPIFLRFDRSFKNIIIYNYTDLCNVSFADKEQIINLIFKVCDKYPKSLILVLLTVCRYYTIKNKDNYVFIILGAFILVNSIYYEESISVKTKIKKLTKFKERKSIEAISNAIIELLTTLSCSIYRPTFDHLLNITDIPKLQRFCLEVDFNNKTQLQLAEAYKHFL